jgi:hypothetical protein
MEISNLRRCIFLKDLETLISMLFNLGFKRYKYCNKLFYPQHNRQVHCSDDHRKEYRSDQQTERRYKNRQSQRSYYISYIDAHGDYITLRSEHLKPGSMRADLKQKRNPNFNEEEKLVHDQLKALGLKG